MRLGGIIFWIVILGLEVYGWRVISSVHAEQSGILPLFIKVLYALGCIFSVAMVLALYLDWDVGSDSLRRYLFSFFMIWMMALMLFCSLLLIDDLRRLVVWLFGKMDLSIGRHDRSRFFYYAGSVLAMFPLVIMTYGMLRNLYNFKKYRVRVPIAGLPESMEGLKIIQISDIHSGTFNRTEPIYDVVERINEEEPDLILFTGDLVNEVAEEIEPYMEAFSGLRAKYGVYSILGNHDYGDYHRDRAPDWDKAANLDRLVQHQADMGWKLLRDENVAIQVGDSTLSLIGMENASSKPYFRNYGDISRAYPGAESADLKILMSHDPSYWREHILDKFTDIALTLSGHTHGMQFGIEIPGFLKWSPVKLAYKEWAGLYAENRQNLYVNRGLGCLGYPGRIGILAEISVLTLTKSI